MLSFYAAFVFYKLRIVPEHFWLARRFLPVILPGALLLVAIRRDQSCESRGVNPPGSPVGRAPIRGRARSYWRYAWPASPLAGCARDHVLDTVGTGAPRMSNTRA